MTNFLMSFFRSHGVTTIHMIIIIPIIFFTLLPAIISFLLICVPIIALIGVFDRTMVINIGKHIMRKIRESTKYDSIKRKWGYALLNNNGVLTKFENSKLNIYEQQLYYKLFREFIGPNTEVCIYKNEDSTAIKNYYLRKFGIDCIVCDKSDDFNIKKETKILTVFYEFDSSKDRIKDFKNFFKIAKRKAMRNACLVNLVICGVIKTSHQNYVEENIPSMMLLKQKKDWSINVSHAINLGIKEKQRYITKKILAPYSMILGKTVKYFDSRIIKSFKSKQIKFLIYKYELKL